jgi:Peptidase C13 family
MHDIVSVQVPSAVSIPSIGDVVRMQAYQVLAAGGVPDDHIVVMVYDDIASSIENPHKGQIFNRPGGPDVYKGMPKVRMFNCSPACLHPTAKHTRPA